MNLGLQKFDPSATSLRPKFDRPLPGSVSSKSHGILIVASFDPPQTDNWITPMYHKPGVCSPEENTDNMIILDIIYYIIHTWCHNVIHMWHSSTWKGLAVWFQATFGSTASPLILPKNTWETQPGNFSRWIFGYFTNLGVPLKTLSHLRPHHRALLGFKRCLTRRGLHDLCWCHKYGDSCRLYDYVHTIMIWCLCSNMRRAIQTCVLCSFRVDMLISICRTSPSSALSLTAAFFAKKNCKGSWIYSSTCYLVFVRTKSVGFFPSKMSMKRQSGSFHVQHDKHGQLIEFWKKKIREKTWSQFSARNIYLQNGYLTTRALPRSRPRWKTNAWSFLQRRLPSTWRSKHAKWQKVQSESSSFMQVKLISSATKPRQTYRRITLIVLVVDVWLNIIWKKCGPNQRYQLQNMLPFKSNRFVLLDGS